MTFAIHSSDATRKPGKRGLLANRLDARLLFMPDGCWNWSGYVTKPGYARISVNSKQLFVHRLMYELYVGPIPEGMEIDHLCRNKSCVRPAHLEPVTHAENGRRGDLALGIRSALTHCKNGHEFTPENTRVNSHQRVCRSCARTWAARRRAEAKAR